jgi:AraC family carnitine catabolism transcriptional activator
MTVSDAQSTRPGCKRSERCYRILLPDFNALATMALIDPFRAANYLSAQKLFDWRFVSATGARVVASNGLAVEVATPLADAGADFDLAVVSASWQPEVHASREIGRWLRRCDATKAILCGIDTGAFVLGLCGLLEGFEATVHYEHLAAFAELFRNVQPASTLFVIDRRRATSCGGAAVSDLALELIRRQAGSDLAVAASLYIFHDGPRPGPRAQLADDQAAARLIPATVRKAIRIMEESIGEPQPLSRIAIRLQLSLRHLERIFRAETGVSPSRYYLDLRLDHARGLLTQTEMSILDVAASSGFSSPDQLTRAYRNRFGTVPSRDRTEGRIPYQFRDRPIFASTRASLKRE